MYVSNIEHKKMFISVVDNTIQNIPKGWNERNCKLALLSIRSVAKAMLEAILQTPFNCEVTPFTVVTKDRLIKDLLFIEYYTRRTRSFNLNYCRSFIIATNLRLDLYRNEILRNKISTEC